MWPMKGGFDIAPRKPVGVGQPPRRPAASAISPPEGPHWNYHEPLK